MKKLPPELKQIGKMQRAAVTDVAHWINHLPIREEYKALFLRLNGYRGWQNLPKYRAELIDIASNGCDITKMLLEGKMCGLSTVHLIVTNADERKRTEVYQLIKEGGVKNTKDEIEKIIGVPAEPRLFDD